MYNELQYCEALRFFSRVMIFVLVMFYDHIIVLTSWSNNNEIINNSR